MHPVILLELYVSFISQVDFNAGVVAAGEAQIESTVTGNTSTVLTSDKIAALKDQSQVYLPINNALSDVGYVMNGCCSYFFSINSVSLTLTFANTQPRPWILERARSGHSAHCIKGGKSD